MQPKIMLRIEGGESVYVDPRQLESLVTQKDF